MNTLKIQCFLVILSIGSLSVNLQAQNNGDNLAEPVTTSDYKLQPNIVYKHGTLAPVITARESATTDAMLLPEVNADMLTPHLETELTHGTEQSDNDLQKNSHHNLHMDEANDITPVVSNTDPASTEVSPPKLTLQYHSLTSPGIRPYDVHEINRANYRYRDQAEENRAPLATSNIRSDSGRSADAGLGFGLGNRWFGNHGKRDLDTKVELANNPVEDTSTTSNIDPLVFGIILGRRF